MVVKSSRQYHCWASFQYQLNLVFHGHTELSSTASDLLPRLISTTHATTEGDPSTVIGIVCLGAVCWKSDPYSQHLNLCKMCHANETHINYLGSSGRVVSWSVSHRILLLLQVIQYKSLNADEIDCISWALANGQAVSPRPIPLCN